MNEYRCLPSPGNALICRPATTFGKVLYREDPANQLPPVVRQQLDLWPGRPGPRRAGPGAAAPPPRPPRRRSGRTWPAAAPRAGPRPSASSAPARRGGPRRAPSLDISRMTAPGTAAGTPQSGTAGTLLSSHAGRPDAAARQGRISRISHQPSGRDTEEKSEPRARSS